MEVNNIALTHFYIMVSLRELTISSTTGSQKIFLGFQDLGFTCSNLKETTEAVIYVLDSQTISEYMRAQSGSKLVGAE